MSDNDSDNAGRSGTAAARGSLTSDSTEKEADVTLDGGTDDFTSVQDAEQFVNENCGDRKIEMNPMMILFTMPLREAKQNEDDTDKADDHIETSTIQLYMANCNHNSPDVHKLNEISNNILGDPCQARSDNRKSFNSDMEFVFIYTEKVGPMCIKH